jgi:hypothetical protein
MSGGLGYGHTIVRSISIAMAALLWLGLAVHAQEIVSPGKGSALRSDILNALRPTIEREVGGRVSFVVHAINVMDRWAYVRADPVRPNGEPINWRNTKFRRAFDADMFSGIVEALLRGEAGHWSLAEFSLGATDVSWVEWVDKHKVPEVLFKTE